MINFKTVSAWHELCQRWHGSIRNNYCGSDVRIVFPSGSVIYLARAYVPYQNVRSQGRPFDDCRARGNPLVGSLWADGARRRRRQSASRKTTAPHRERLSRPTSTGLSTGLSERLRAQAAAPSSERWYAGGQARGRSGPFLNLEAGSWKLAETLSSDREKQRAQAASSLLLPREIDDELLARPLRETESGARSRNSAPIWCLIERAILSSFGGEEGIAGRDGWGAHDADWSWLSGLAGGRSGRGLDLT
ncbi:hypothetical protein Mp_3g16000 [Marchantia polymorpha subsp. ruderalis]|uniref:Uncharacterized protein n=2 Tax=Marchantia polymorpha TaxID=3197 RepID=A0AAF6B1A9_MARPO|nr:hypothetical protein MARPO_0004s0072 [Marchantia polymorpha]BBN05793.1 hypothetical protein Mp_3g16000 [Marchantia polymorpha subsp. ruderalis]|eukprot:PTQ48785.1 hypothetical protein MARPO_0004s0072 [Marchantia polymorpha]